MTLTQEEALRIFHYAPDTGIVTRRVPVVSGKGAIRWKEGCIVGSISKSNGYMEVSVNHEHCLLHRVIWLMCYGYFPEGDIDHVNRDKLDNRLSNLREVSRSCNTRNVGLRRTNTSGVRGVSFCPPVEKWEVYITVNYVRYSLGYFEDLLEAAAVRLAAEQCLGWEVCDASSSACKFVCDYIRSNKK